ncbi:MAG: ECF transporter S component [Firmicutes bacterium]|nr:ECF transporter S component [Bacillota bacterium]HOB34598.1 ECF transporter S component [Bacillota bacterium]HPZ90745.1 ECF transporter S component [Bacillota bacterium]HQE02578.1 ECF transporter S component [Bacillota bacterium]
MEKRVFATTYLVKVGLLAALSYMLMYLDDIFLPLTRLIFPEFLKLDFADVPALIGGFALGPLAGTLVALIRNIIYFLTKSSTAGVGSAANFVTAVSLVIPASLIYQRLHTRKGALIGMLAGTLSMTAVMAVTNYYIFLPLFARVMEIPLNVVVQAGAKVNPWIVDLRTFVLFATAPFNLLKGILVSLVTLAVYKHISRLFKHF